MSRYKYLFPGEKEAHAGAIAAVCGLLLHSLVDFNLHITSNALLFLLQAHLASTTPLPSQGSPMRQRKRARGHDGELNLDDPIQSERSLAPLAELLELQRRRHGTELR